MFVLCSVKHGGWVDFCRIQQTCNWYHRFPSTEYWHGQNDVIQFRLNWLYNAVVRYCDNIPPGEAILALIQEAKEQLRQNENGSCSENVAFQAEIATTGEQGRSSFIIAKDQLEFLLDFSGLNP